MTDPIPSERISAELLDRYLAGECTPIETDHVTAWIAADPRRTSVRTWRTVAPSANVDAAWIRVASRTTKSGTAGSLRSVSTTRPSRSRAVWYTATGLIACAILAIFLLHQRVRTWTWRASVAGSTYATNNGQRANITLSDGSTVTLDVASRLDVPPDYPSGNHTLRLQGAALFTVTHHDGAPVTVLIGQTAARVLGTSFVVRHYMTDTTTTIAVRDGKIAIHTNTGHAERAVVLTEAQQADITPQGVTHIHATDPAQFSFARGVLVLNGGLLSQAIPDLDRWYDADIRLGSPELTTRRLTGEYAAGSLTDLMAILEMTFNARIVRDGRVLTIYPK